MPRRTLLVPVLLGLCSCAKPYLASFHADERIDITHCSETDRAEIKRFLDSVDWRGRALRNMDFIRPPKESESLQVVHVMEDSAVTVSFEARFDPDHYWDAGWVFEGIVQTIQVQAEGCDLKVFAQSLPAKGGEAPAPLPDSAWYSLPLPAQTDLWFAELKTSSPTPHTAHTFPSKKGPWLHPDPIEFEKRFREDPETRLAILFVTIPAVHPVYHALIFKEETGGLRAAYSRFHDGKFIWKADLALDRAAAHNLAEEIDFLEKANTRLLGRPDYIDQVVQTRCQSDLYMDKAKSDSAFQAVREACLDRSRDGVILDKGRRAPIYLYRLGNLAQDRDRRVLFDLRAKTLQAILKSLPAGQVTWERKPSGR